LDSLGRFEPFQGLALTPERVFFFCSLNQAVSPESGARRQDILCRPNRVANLKRLLYRRRSPTLIETTQCSRTSDGEKKMPKNVARQNTYARRFGVPLRLRRLNVSCTLFRRGLLRQAVSMRERSLDSRSSRTRCRPRMVISDWRSRKPSTGTEPSPSQGSLRPQGRRPLPTPPIFGALSCIQRRAQLAQVKSSAKILP
jgi:hypothetical protein